MQQTRLSQKETKWGRVHRPFSVSLLVVISLIWPAGEHTYKSESCLSTLVTGVDHSTGTLSMNIHQFHNMPAPNIVSLSLSRINIKTPQPGGVASHVCDSYFTVSSKIPFFFIISSYLVHKLMVTLKPQLVGGLMPTVASTEEALLRDGSMKRFNLGGMSVRVTYCCGSCWSCVVGRSPSPAARLSGAGGESRNWDAAWPRPSRTWRLR